MTKTRHVDEFGNVSYVVRDGEQAIARIAKTCSGWQLEFPDETCVPVRSVRDGMEWFASRDRILAMPKVTA
jgi:hypothetical protein